MNHQYKHTIMLIIIVAMRKILIIPPTKIKMNNSAANNMNNSNTRINENVNGNSGINNVPQTPTAYLATLQDMGAQLWMARQILKQVKNKITDMDIELEPNEINLIHTISKQTLLSFVSVIFNTRMKNDRGISNIINGKKSYVITMQNKIN